MLASAARMPFPGATRAAATFCSPGTADLLFGHDRGVSYPRAKATLTGAGNLPRQSGQPVNLPA